MNALQKDLQEVLAKHIALAPHKLPRLIEALSGDELVFGQPMQLGFTGGRFINVGADGKPASGDHVAIYDQEADLIWAAAPLPKGNHSETVAAAASLKLLNLADWRLPTVKELIGGPVDYTRYNPVLDKQHFGQWPSEYVWTSTPDTDPSDAASYSFVVGLHDGYVYRHRRGNRFLALAVRAGQPLGFQF